MKMTSNILMTTSALILMLGVGAQAADAVKKEIPSKEKTEQVVVPPIGIPPSAVQAPASLPPASLPPGVQPGTVLKGMPEGEYFYGNAMRAMHEKMMMLRSTGSADEDFIQGILVHYQGTIEMARIALEKGSDADVKKLAQGIIDSQTAESKWMQDWLEKRHK